MDYHFSRSARWTKMKIRKCILRVLFLHCVLCLFLSTSMKMYTVPCLKFLICQLFPDSDLWFPMNSSTPGPVPLCSRGHSATYDPDSRSVCVYGGLREGQRYSELYVLNTLTWKWKLINVSLWQTSQTCNNLWSSSRWFFGDSLPSRPKATFRRWRIIPPCFIRRSSLSLVESILDSRLEKSPAVTLFTSSTRSLSSGTSPSWRGTDRCLGLGPCSLT